MKTFPFTFDPRQKGLRKILGETEHAIMEVLWKRGERNVRDVCEDLRDEKKLAYTTVMTVMSRLFDKGLLHRRKVGRGFAYRPVLTRERFTQSVVRRMMHGLMQDFMEPTMSQFVSALDRQDEGRMDELSRIIEEKRRNRDA